MSLTAIGIITLCVIVGLVLVVSEAFSAKRRNDTAPTPVCMANRHETLTGSYATETRPRQWYHIRVPVKRRERVDI